MAFSFIKKIQKSLYVIDFEIVDLRWSSSYVCSSSKAWQCTRVEDAAGNAIRFKPATRLDSLTNVDCHEQDRSLDWDIDRPKANKLRPDRQEMAAVHTYLSGPQIRNTEKASMSAFAVQPGGPRNPRFSIAFDWQWNSRGFPQL